MTERSAARLSRLHVQSKTRLKVPSVSRFGSVLYLLGFDIDIDIEEVRCELVAVVEFAGGADTRRRIPRLSPARRWPARAARSARPLLGYASMSPDRTHVATAALAVELRARPSRTDRGVRRGQGRRPPRQDRVRSASIVAARVGRRVPGFVESLHDPEPIRRVRLRVQQVVEHATAPGKLLAEIDRAKTPDRTGTAPALSVALRVALIAGS